MTITSLKDQFSAARSRVPTPSRCLGLLLLSLSMPGHADTTQSEPLSQAESQAQSQAQSETKTKAKAKQQPQAPAQPRPPWLQQDVLQAAFAIKMSQEQLPQYRTALTNLVQGYQKSMNKLLQRNNVSNLKQKMKSATNRQFSRFDKAMFKFLDDSQRGQYGVYRDLLKTRLVESARSGATTGSRDAGRINADIDGFSNAN